MYMYVKRYVTVQFVTFCP